MIHTWLYLVIHVYQTVMYRAASTAPTQGITMMSQRRTSQLIKLSCTVQPVQPQNEVHLDLIYGPVQRGCIPDFCAQIYEGKK
jgi:hypothetical protein